ncbi:T9SS type A sorting domain-containing protein [Psychroserpens mesophilus]|uniref:T9SS type A sorting domain-containing protein n=1 Tax=Psychroserpens mesophilus TaxID=325473 RepID=UPI003D662DD7
MKRFILNAMLVAIAISSYSQSNVIEVEYFLDTDNGFGSNNTVAITSPDTDITQVVLADIPASTSIGYHKLYIRTKDSDGNWSHTTRKNIEVFTPVVENNIVLGEYFIDEDPQFGVATPFTINPESDDILQQFAAQIAANETLGYHKLYGRVQDSYGRWSHTFRKNIEVYLNPDSNVVEVEYFFDEDLDQGFGNNLNVVLSSPESDGTWSFDVSYPTGAYNFDDVLFVRAKDSNGKWSITTILDEVSLSTDEVLYQSTKIFPNPFTDVIQIESTLNHEFKSIQVIDLTGKVVFESASNFNTISLGNLSKGVYILRLVTNKSEANFKIVKK